MNLRQLFSGRRKFITIPIVIIFILTLFPFAIAAIPSQPQPQVEQVQPKPFEPSTSPSVFKAQTAPNNPDIILARVTKVIDGDTIEVDLGEGDKKIVRYIGIDTPETVDPRKGVQCFGEEASAKNKELVGNGTVGLEKDVSETDKYGRLLRYVYMGDLFINQVLVSEGYARVSSYPPDIKYQEKLRESEQDAKANKKGLWADNACDTNSTNTPSKTPTQQPSATSGTYTCNCSKICTQISSCDEAYFQLNQCGCSVRDADGDGVPCESICR